ncbi:hypothetical protein K8R66_02620 [bacterium]|nr:hypothetical protein [bacterium]
MEPLYRVILKKAWEITRKYKFLWIFGVFALWLGNGGEMQIFFKTLYSVEDFVGSALPEVVRDFFPLLAFYGDINLSNIIPRLLYFLSGLIIFLLAIWTIIISQIAIIKSTDYIFNNKKKNINFKTVLNDSKEHFLSVLGLNILTKFFISLVVVFISIPLLIFIIKFAGYSRFWIGLVVWLIFLPIAVIFSFVMRYAINFVIIKGEKFWESMAKAWILFKTNWLISLEMTIALLLINLIVGLIVGFLTIIIVGPFSRIDILTYYALSNFSLGLIMFKVLPILIIYLLAGSGLAVFQTVSWTLLFDRIVSGKRYSKIVRIVASLSNYTKTNNQISNSADINKIEKTIIRKRRIGRPKKK